MKTIDLPTTPEVATTAELTAWSTHKEPHATAQIHHSIALITDWTN